MTIRLGRTAGRGGRGASDPFTDLLFNTLIGFMLLFFIAIIFLNPEEKKANVDLDAQYVITVTWPDGLEDDIDTWVQEPGGGLVWFRNRNAGLVHLDRDDRGMLNDTVRIGNEVVDNPLNQEVIAIRGTTPGEYIVNIHYFETAARAPVPVSVKLARVNPVYKVLFYETIVLAQKGAEETAMRFVLSSGGSVIDINRLAKRLVRF